MMTLMVVWAGLIVAQAVLFVVMIFNGIRMERDIKRLMEIYHGDSLPDLKKKFFDAHRDDDPLMWDGYSSDFPDSCDTLEKKLEYKWYRESNDHHCF